MIKLLVPEKKKSTSFEHPSEEEDEGKVAKEVRRAL